MSRIKSKLKRIKLASEVRKRLGLTQEGMGSLRHFKTLTETEKIILLSHMLIKLEKEGYLSQINLPLDIHLIRDITLKLGVSYTTDPKYSINDLYEGFKSELQKSEFEHISISEKARRVIKKLEKDGVIDAIISKFEKEKKEILGEKDGEQD